jgi:hypothetical protein
MNNPVPGVNNFAGMTYLDVGFRFENSADRFSNDFDISFNSPSGLEGLFESP